MKERVLGNDLKVSEIGLGTMSMSFGYGKTPDPKEMVKVLQEAVELGEHFFDTAEVYGPYVNEELLGEALAPYKKQVTIATKGGIKVVDGKQVVDGRPEELVKSVEDSLKRLGLEAIDLYYLHRVDPNTPIEDIAFTMQKLIKAGKIKHWGLSEAGVNTIRKAHAVEPLTAVESEYSLWTREPEIELLPVLEELNIGFVPFSPLGKGFLTGTISADKEFESGDSRGALPRFQKEAMAANQKLVDVIKEFAKDKEATPAQIALAWLLAQKPWIVPIPGTTKIHRVKENMGAANLQLTHEEIAALTKAADEIQIIGHRYTPELAKRVGL
ncbi:aldo/keto reductase [Enterococcus sp. HY326]|uniref:aldo/keto reductase n=1 Tax=Enterococcus sp. HY326 TaxID=2971265 RepID=UPI0022401BFF|nr:aldo/keto reductase [Enterococcus sp. HY326]